MKDLFNRNYRNIIKNVYKFEVDKLFLYISILKKFNVYY